MTTNQPTAEHANVLTLTAEHADVLTLTAEHADVLTLTAEHADVLTLTAGHADVLTLTACAYSSLGPGLHFDRRYLSVGCCRFEVFRF